MTQEAWEDCIKEIAQLKADIGIIKGQIDVLIQQGNSLNTILKFVVTPLIIGVLALFGIKAIVPSI